MKKLLIVLLSILAISTIAIFIFIPANIVINHSATIGNSKLSRHFLADSSAWRKWFPQQTGYEQFPVCNDMLLALDSSFANGFTISMTNGEMENSGTMSLQNQPADSLKIDWTSHWAAGMNPAKRLKAYGYSLQVKKSMVMVLDSLKAFMAKQPKADTLLPANQ